MTRRTTMVRGACAAVAILLLSGCGLSNGVYDVPLPGGADLGSSPMTVKADFADVLELVPQSSVKVDDVPVGRVTKIRINPGGRSARVSMLVNGSVRLPAGTAARIQQTSLLGEKYVSLVRPAGSTATTGALMRSGAVVPLSATTQAVGVEQVLGALSLLLNGGGLGQFQEISRELQAVSTGRPEQVRGFLEEMKTFVTTLDGRSSSITTALDGLDKLSTSLAADKGKLTNAIDNLSPGLQVLVDQRQQLVRMLSALDRLSTVTVRTLKASQQDMVRDLELLRPVLDQLAKSGKDLPQALEIMLTYPFPDSVLGAVKGDYLNIFITTALNTPGGAVVGGRSWPRSGAVVLGTSTITPPPLLLPTTTSAAPGSGPTVSTSASASASAGSPSGSGSGSGSPSGSGTPTATDPGSPSAPPASDSGSPSGSPSGSSGSPSGTGSSGAGSSGTPDGGQ